MKVGFIGTGRMGQAMVRRMLEAKHEVGVYNRTPEKAKPLSRPHEIETYTWDVLPDQLKTGDIVDYVSREIEWVKGQLQCGHAPRPLSVKLKREARKRKP